ncbi:MAG: 50S ribosomal protein L24 [Candidatus Woesearchaeota archaeon]|jgi:large subunit ribosomal protein L24
MKTKFSKTWISSTQPRKQRKYRFNAPLTVKRKFLSINLSKELRTKHGIRNIKPRVGDKVKVERGTYKSKTGSIERIDTKNTKIYITKIELTKKDGSKSKVPINPSNLQITELDLTDKIRKNNLAKKTEASNKQEEISRQVRSGTSSKQEAK